MRLLTTCVLLASFLSWPAFSNARLTPSAPRPAQLSKRATDGLQDIVTWDEHSVFVYGERIMLYSGSFHPFRLPVVGLWLDIFQKIKALGRNTVTFYLDWALLEGKEGDFSAEGIFAMQPFFDAASEAGIYLIVRPGPYINAEVSGGGFPGWLQRVKAPLRTPEYFNYTVNYLTNVAKQIAAAQITKGGPVVMVQVENELSVAGGADFEPSGASERSYMQAIEDLFRANGIVVPLDFNDASPLGDFTPGSGNGSVDIYGFDSYPLNINCANPYDWADDALPTNFYTLHEDFSPTTPNSIPEAGGGSSDVWGGPGADSCLAQINIQGEKVLYKNYYSFGTTILNFYMTYGGTNWGNIAYPQGYTSYDYGAVISEERLVSRGKYSESKMQSNFLKVSPAYLTSHPTANATNGSYTNTDSLAVTPLADVVGNKTKMYVVRHAAYNSYATTLYKLDIDTSIGPVSLPALGGDLTMGPRDSKVRLVTRAVRNAADLAKIHVSDYSVGQVNMIYSTAEIFTWQEYTHKTVLVLYGGIGETHEVAFNTAVRPQTIENGQDIRVEFDGTHAVLNFNTTSERKLVLINGNLYVYILDEPSAYNFWVLDLPGSGVEGNHSTTSSVIVNGGYLLRTARISQGTLYLTGDINATTTLEIVGSPEPVKSLYFNAQHLATTPSTCGGLVGTVKYLPPDFSLPSLLDLEWKYVDSLPEITPGYDDSLWTEADHASSNNPQTLVTPTSLYASDYGFNVGMLVYRGHFVAPGNASSLTIQTQGGSAFAVSFWLNSTFLGSYAGLAQNISYAFIPDFLYHDYNMTNTFSLPKLSAGQDAVITVLIENMGQEENVPIGLDQAKIPRGIMSYDITGVNAAAVTWKLTGNLGGEDYRDRTRGPLNEGGLYAERQGYHLPDPPTQTWIAGKPTDGLEAPGVAFYTTSFDLDMPTGYDIPLAFVFTNTTTDGVVPNYRSQLYVNGYQFGIYVNNIGPQTSFPVPEGILNYHGTNYIAVSLWAQDPEGNKLTNLELIAGPSIQSGYGTIGLSPMPAYTPRPGAY